MKRNVAQSSLSKAVFPLSAFGLVLTAAQPATARDEQKFLGKFNQRQLDMQEKAQRRDILQDQREFIRNARLQNLHVNRNDINRSLSESSVQKNFQLPDAQLKFQSFNQQQFEKNGRSFFVNDNGKLKSIKTGIDLDLTSDTRSVKLGANLFDNSSSLSLKVGDSDKTFVAGSMATAAEYLALQQKIDNGQQGLVLNNSGSAIDGSISLNSISENGAKIKATSLVIPVSVDAVGDFSKQSTFRLTGNLTNYGNVFALSTDSNATAANFSAKNITNHAGAVITTNTGNAVGDLVGLKNGPLDLNLQATNSFSNYGLIESSGNLSIVAGRSITNGNVGATSTLASMTAAGSLSLKSPTVSNAGQLLAANSININAPGQLLLVNSGIISSANQDVNIQTLIADNVFVNNQNGQISAVQGSINAGKEDTDEKYNTKISGGDLNSKTVNINSGTGDADVIVNNLSGVLNMTAGNTHAGAWESSLTLGEINASGDPLFFSGSDLNISAAGTTGDIVYLAGRDINWDPTAGASNIAGNNQNIRFVAGADISTDGTYFYVTGGSASGGNINFTGTGAYSVTTNASANAIGDIEIVAFAGNERNGELNLSGSSTISAGTGTRGNLEIYAEGGIHTVGADATTTISGHDVKLSAARPVAYGQNGVQFDASGNLIGGDFTSGTTATGSIDFKGNVTATRLLELNAYSNQGITIDGTVTAATLLIREVGDCNLHTNVDNLSVQASSSLTIDEFDSILLTRVTTGSIILTAGNDIIGSTGFLKVDSGFTLFTANGSIGSETTPLLFDSNSAVIDVSIHAGNDIYVSNIGFGTARLSNSSAENDFVISNAFSIPDGVTVSAGRNFTAVRSRNLVNDGKITAGQSISISGFPSFGLTIDGGTDGGEMVAPTINLTATSANLTFQNQQTFSGVVNMSAVANQNSKIIVTSGASVIGDDVFNVLTRTFENSGSFNAPSINFVSNQFSLINEHGDVTLTGNINFAGQSIAILASGSVYAGPATSIDLSSATGDGGDLTIIAGFDFQPTNRPLPDGSYSFTNFTPNTSGGSINLSNVSINTSGHEYGGNVTLFANGNSAGSGEIHVGTINSSSATADGGSVILFAGRSISSGAINSEAPGYRRLGGSVFAEIKSFFSGGFAEVTDGVLTGFINSSDSAGNISLSSVNAGNGDFLAQTSNGGSIVATGPLNGFSIALSAAGGTIDIRGLSGITATADPDGRGGAISLSADSIALTSSASNPFALSANGASGNFGDGGSIFFHTNEITPLQIGTSAKPARGSKFISMSATGLWDGGELDVSTGGQLNVQTEAFNAAGGSGIFYDGPTYRLESGTTSSSGGGIAITGSLTAIGAGSATNGVIQIKTNSRSAFVIGSDKTVKTNGIQGNLRIESAATGGGAINIENIGGGITLSRTSALYAPTVSLVSSATSGTILTSGGAVITAEEFVYLRTAAGAVGARSGLFVNAPTINANSLLGTVSLNASGGNTILGSAGKSFTVTSAGGLEIGSISTNSGSILVKNSSGSISVSNSAHLIANNGSITINALNSSASDVYIGANSIIETAGANGGNVSIAIGALPRRGTNTLVPSGVTVNRVGSGEAFFGPGGLNTSAGNISINAINKNVILNNISQTGRVISIGANAVITADPPSATPLITKPAESALEPASSKYLGYITPLSSDLKDVPSQLLNGSTAVDSIHLNSQLGTLGPYGLTQRIPSQSVPFGGVQTVDNDDLHNHYVLDAFVWCEKDLGICKTASLLPARAATNETTGSTNDLATLTGGSVLFAPQKHTKLKTPFGCVEMEAGTLSLLVATEHSLCLYDLHDTKKGSISLTVENKVFALSPGNCMVIAKQHVSSFHEVNPMEAVGYRRLKEANYGNNFKVFHSEFSVLHAMNVVKPLGLLMATSHPDGRRLTGQFLKTTAILLHLSGNCQEYTFYPKPSLSAYLQN